MRVLFEIAKDASSSNKFPGEVTAVPRKGESVVLSGFSGEANGMWLVHQVRYSVNSEMSDHGAANLPVVILEPDR